MDPSLALDAIGQLPDEEIDIAQAALLFALVDQPAGDWAGAAAHLSVLVREMVDQADGMASQTAPARAGVVSALMGRHGYAGDTATYDSPANANLLQVIERRRGLPIALGVLWLHAARAVGWPFYGLDFPGHFLLAVGGPVPLSGIRSSAPGRVVVDVFAGGMPLENDALLALLRRTHGPQAELHPGMLAPMPARAVLLRLQRNVQGRRAARGDVAGARACVRDMLRIDPENVILWQDAALLSTRMGDVEHALECHRRVLALVPEGSVARRTQRAMDELQG